MSEPLTSDDYFQEHVRDWEKRDRVSALTPDQIREFDAHLRACNARETCTLCDAGQHILAFRFVEGLCLISRTCAHCRLVTFFDYRPITMGRIRESIARASARLNELHRHLGGIAG